MTKPSIIDGFFKRIKTSEAGSSSLTSNINILASENQSTSFRIDDIYKLVNTFYPHDFADHEKLQLKTQLQHYEYNVVQHSEFRNLLTFSSLCQWSDDGYVSEVVEEVYVSEIVEEVVGSVVAGCGGCEPKAGGCAGYESKTGGCGGCESMRYGCIPKHADMVEVDDDEMDTEESCGHH
ncbi:hypothetical protein Q3G72_032283 [Acer saccharum]|nr:hypothetical protein Q3G72_032283 [Acer saccharum]